MKPTGKTNPGCLTIVPVRRPARRCVFSGVGTSLEAACGCSDGGGGVEIAVVDSARPAGGGGGVELRTQTAGGGAEAGKRRVGEVCEFAVRVGGRHGGGGRSLIFVLAVYVFCGLWSRYL